MKHLTIIALFLISVGAFAQTGTYDEASVKVKPEFPGGEDGLTQFIQNNARRVGGYTGRNDEFAEILFVVETDGSLTGLKANYMGVTTEWITEALRVMLLSPKWTPAKHDGKPVRCKVKRVLKNPHFQTFDDNITIDAPGTELGAAADRTIQEDGNEIYTVARVDVKPEFRGGMKKFYDYFDANFRIPDTGEVKGKVFASFVVEKDGALSDIRIIRDLGFGTGKELVRTLKKCPKWKPGELNGKKVRVQYSLPFSIDSQKKK